MVHIHGHRIQWDQVVLGKITPNNQRTASRQNYIIHTLRVRCLIWSLVYSLHRVRVVRKKAKSWLIGPHYRNPARCCPQSVFLVTFRMCNFMCRCEQWPLAGYLTADPHCIYFASRCIFGIGWDELFFSVYCSWLVDCVLNKFSMTWLDTCFQSLCVRILFWPQFWRHISWLVVVQHSFLDTLDNLLLYTNKSRHTTSAFTKIILKSVTYCKYMSVCFRPKCKHSNSTFNKLGMQYHFIFT